VARHWFYCNDHYARLSLISNQGNNEKNGNKKFLKQKNEFFSNFSKFATLGRKEI
jgi:hypothetical protein